MSTATLVRVPMVEAAGTAAPTSPGHATIQLITPGWGASGYYSEQVLQEAAAARVFPVGLHMYMDHPTATEEAERPVRSLRDLAAVLTEDARWDPARGALVAPARVLGPYRPMITEAAGDIGVSIRGYAEAEQGEAQGRRGTVFTRLVAAESVDFVTKAGRGGRILAITESARHVAEARNIGQWLESRIHQRFTIVADEMFGDGRLTREERITLSLAIGDALGAFVARVEADAPHLYERDPWTEPPGGDETTTAMASEARRRAAEALPGGHTADTLRTALADAVKDTHGGEKTWTWIQDFTDTAVYFRVESETDGALYQQAYTASTDGAITLAGDRVEVRAETTYAPVAQQATETAPAPVPPADPTAPPAIPAEEKTPTREGDSRMAEIPDAELASLREAASRTHTLDTQLVEARRDLTEARAQVGALGDNTQRMVEAERQRDASLAETRRLRAVVAAGPVIDRALSESGLPAPLWPRVTATVLGHEGRSVPLSEAGALDTDALGAAVTAAIDTERTLLAQLAAVEGAGIPRGLGAVVEGDTDPTADLEATFREIGLSESAATLAAKGR